MVGVVKGHHHPTHRGQNVLETSTGRKSRPLHLNGKVREGQVETSWGKSGVRAIGQGETTRGSRGVQGRGGQK